MQYHDPGSFVELLEILGAKLNCFSDFLASAQVAAAGGRDSQLHSALTEGRSSVASPPGIGKSPRLLLSMNEGSAAFAGAETASPFAALSTDHGLERSRGNLSLQSAVSKAVTKKKHMANQKCLIDMSSSPSKGSLISGSLGPKAVAKASRPRSSLSASPFQPFTMMSERSNPSSARSTGNVLESPMSIRNRTQHALSAGKNVRQTAVTSKNKNFHGAYATVVTKPNTKTPRSKPRASVRKGAMNVKHACKPSLDRKGRACAIGSTTEGQKIGLWMS